MPCRTPGPGPRGDDTPELHYVPGGGTGIRIGVSGALATGKDDERIHGRIRALPDERYCRNSQRARFIACRRSP
jgi:hypothetical protein